MGHRRVDAAVNRLAHEPFALVVGCLHRLDAVLG
jgi:hypothetical protein